MNSTAEGLTKNQGLVFETLSEAGTPMSAYDILDQLRGQGLRAPLQVYRALDKLVDQGVVHRLESLNAFVACRHEKCHDIGFVAFAICDTCNHVSEFSDTEVTERLGAWAKKNRFAATKTTIEIRGECSSCTAA